MKTSEVLLPILSDWFTDLKEKTKEWENREENSEVVNDSIQ